MKIEFGFILLDDTVHPLGNKNPFVERVLLGKDVFMHELGSSIALYGEG